MLQHAAVTGAPEVPPSTVDALVVVPGCDCGCASLDFREDKTGERLLADAVATYADGEMAGLMLWGRPAAQGDAAIELLWLEVYQMTEDGFERFPAIAELKPAHWA
jgi:hypothetical protein